MMINTSIAPMLSVRRGAEAVAFYQSAFGAEVLFQIDNDAGEIVAQLAVAGAAFWVADESPDHGNYSPETLGGSTTRMILTVDDPDALFNRAIAAGAEQINPIEEAHGWRVGRIVDPYGHHWEIGRPLQSEELSTE
jgi:PhnB protein